MAAKKSPKPATTYSDKLANEICEQIISGKSLLAVSKIEGMPTYQAMMNWLNPTNGAYRESFLYNYARAREIRADTLVDQAFEIAEKARLTNEGIAKARLQIDLIKWTAGKMSPKKYGDKLDLLHSGTGKNNAILVELAEIENSGLSRPRDRIKEKDSG